MSEYPSEEYRRSKWFDYQLENDPRFLERIERARRSLRSGKGVRLEDVEKPKAARRR